MSSPGFYERDLPMFLDFYLDSDDVFEGDNAGKRSAERLRGSYEDYVAECKEDGDEPQPWREVRDMVLSDLREIRPILRRYLEQMEKTLMDEMVAELDS